MKSAVFNHYQYLSEAPSPALAPVLTQALQQELNQLLASLRKQVHNVVAVGQWWERRQQGLGTVRQLPGQLPPLALGQTEELSFQLKAAPEAFALFTNTLRQTSFYLHENARIDAQQQVLKVRVDFRNLAAWAYELSVLFEQLTPARYLNTLRYEQQRLRLPARKAS